MELTLTDQNFEEQVLKATTPVLVDFYADWCGPCKMMAPIIDQIAGEYESKLVVGKLDVDANQQTAQKYGVMSIPTLIIFKAGQPAKQLVGYQGKEALVKEINNII
ncbi:MAG: thioredoxin [Patescibacteria group bacterium]|nr:thioredoxin [Patescibacteria group bacterium]MCL5431865.1 thioredoxin [Patescibacteria group bacterium]